MTMTLPHPPAEDLGCFVEGTLDDAERAAVIAHIADCDECRIVVVDATAFREESAAAHGEGGRWWLGVAAAIAIVLGGAFIVNARRDPLAPVIEASAHLRSRPVDARLSGFTHVGRSNMRGGDHETDLAETQLDGEVGRVLERRGDDPRTLHAKGVARLLAAALLKVEYPNEVDAERAKAVDALQSAADREPNNARYLSDLAGALIATGGPANLDRAVATCNRALKIDPRSPEALFNRAIALRDLGNARGAISAFKLYLIVDPSSPWADEARQSIDLLK
jgi:tetratricopeptide (TPR) repeat protein